MDRRRKQLCEAIKVRVKDNATNIMLTYHFHITMNEGDRKVKIVTNPFLPILPN